MSGINSTLPLKTINFKASNTVVSQPVVKQQQKETTLDEKVFNKPLDKAKYVAAISGGLGFLTGMALGLTEKSKNLAGKIGTGLGLGIVSGLKMAAELTIIYLILAAAVNYLRKDDTKTQ